RVYPKHRTDDLIWVDTNKCSKLYSTCRYVTSQLAWLSEVRPMIMKKLSERQQAVLDYIAAFLDQNDYPPTIRDIKNELNISSTSVVDYNLKVLEERDLIRRNRNISRGIELVGRVPQRNNTTVPVNIVG